MKGIKVKWTGPGLGELEQTEEENFLQEGNKGIHINLIHEKITENIVGIILMNDGNFSFQKGQKVEIEFL